MVSICRNSNMGEQVLIVMDGLQEFSMEALEWVLQNTDLMACCNITILGVMPWLTIPLYSKTVSDIWAVNLQHLLTITEKDEWKSDVKDPKIQLLIDICLKYGVVPQIKTESGFPLRGIVVEQITNNRATLVVFDRHHDKKNIEYYAEKVECNIVRINEEGEVDMMKAHSQIDDRLYNTHGESTSSMEPTAKSIFLENWKNWKKTLTRYSRSSDQHK